MYLLLIHRVAGLIGIRMLGAEKQTVGEHSEVGGLLFFGLNNNLYVDLQVFCISLEILPALRGLKFVDNNWAGFRSFYDCKF